jgi:hypothetical protein
VSRLTGPEGLVAERRNQTMKLFRHLGLMIAVFWCAVMVLVPLAASADTGYGTNQGMNQGTNQAPGSQDIGPGQVDQGNTQGNTQGNNQMQQGPGQATGTGNTMVRQEGNNQNNAATGQGNRPGGFGNATALGNRTMHAPESGTMTPEKPAGDTANMTAMNSTIWHGHGAGNMTDIQPPMGGNPTNTTAMNSTPWHGDGNMTPHAPPAQGNIRGQGQQQVQNQQETQDQVNSTGDLIAQFLEWLKAQGIT